jgi:CDP-diacylglycerol---serine O-phosphatidyltransferase
LPIYAQDLGLHLPTLTPLVLLYTLAVALLMVSRVPTFSGKLIGQKIAREYVLPVFVLVALFIACLLTYPSLTLAVGSVIYLALIPVSAYRYFQVERKMELIAKGQNGKGATEPTAIEPPSFPR